VRLVRGESSLLKSVLTVLCHLDWKELFAQDVCWIGRGGNWMDGDLAGLHFLACAVVANVNVFHAVGDFG